MKPIYIIVWTGRDCDSEIWGTYPCYEYGYFTDMDEVLAYARKWNELEEFEYDSDAEETPYYAIKEIKPYIKEQDDD